MVIGAKLGIKLLQNASLRMYWYYVFYDRDLEGNVGLNIRMGADLVAKF